MFFITRLTENTNLAVTIPPYEHIFNSARINISMVKGKFAELDVIARRKTEHQNAGAGKLAADDDDDDDD
jgi:Ras-related GTP-binding protein A/B